MCTRAGAPARNFTAQPTAAAVTQAAAPAPAATATAQQAAAPAPVAYGRMPMGGAATMSASGNPTVTASAPIYTTSDRTVEETAPETIISKSTYRAGVYSVSALNGGGIQVSALRGQRTGSEHDSNSHPEYRYTTSGAYIDAGKAGFNSDYRDRRDETIVKGVNWGNVKFVVGDTYYLRPELKALGFRWNSANRRWEK